MLFKNSAEELELQEGKLTLRELSLWFGLAPTTISNGSTKSKEKKFNTLSFWRTQYYYWQSNLSCLQQSSCDCWKRVSILDEDGKANPVLKKERIDTCTRVGKDIYHTFPEVSSQISEKTTI